MIGALSKFFFDSKTLFVILYVARIAAIPARRKGRRWRWYWMIRFAYCEAAQARNFLCDGLSRWEKENGDKL